MERNNLYPVFLKTSQLRILVVGGGYVAEEKLGFLTKSSPDSNITLLSPMIREATAELANAYAVVVIEDIYKAEYLEGFHLVIATTNNPDVNRQIYEDCRERDKLVNVADNPPLCDFYMGGIVTKGHVKVAISTNGKSPTTAKRLRQFFEEILPDDISAMVENLHQYRKKLKGNFEYKVERMNQLTESLANEDDL
ncbi:MAG: precorrin-2 dehydrogenase/sirohydrochlorin ferrochelatase family protein [Flavobacteriaceae bacterium]